jgi:hypothetical protein
MRDSKRIPVILSRLSALWNHYPDMRFFQLIRYVQSEIYISDNAEDDFYIEDDRALRMINNLIKEAEKVWEKK